MAETFETPISALVKQGYDAVKGYLVKNGPWLFFQWLALIYLKTYLKDKNLRLYLDRRRGDGTVSDLYAWKELHHIHCIARSFYTNAIIDESVMGSFVLWRATSLPGQELYDYGDSYVGRTVMLRLGEVALIAVLNDSGAVRSAMDKGLSRLPVPLSPLQLRELMTRMAHTNIRLSERPKFHSYCSGAFLNSTQTKKRMFVGKYTIGVERPEKIILDELNLAELGEMLVFNLRGPITEIVPPEEREGLVETMRDGLHSFILNAEGDVVDTLAGNDERDEPMASDTR